MNLEITHFAHGEASIKVGVSEGGASIMVNDGSAFFTTDLSLQDAKKLARAILHTVHWAEHVARNDIDD